MKKVFNFGKIDYLNIGRKTCPVKITIELKETCKGLEFTASGMIYNHLKTDCYCGGQCLDTINNYLGKNPMFKKIYRLWKLYHLNGMNAGTKEQTEFVKQWLEKTNQRYDYTKVKKFLKLSNMYKVEYQGELYEYGSAWLLHEIPQEDLNIIRKLLEE